MTADQWPRVKDIFHAAIERAPGNRAAFVIEACGGDAALRAEVERLVAAHDRAGSFIEQSPVAAGEPRQTSLSGRVIGRYEVGRLLGAGGMGEVYAARDVELGRQVALKIATGFDADAQTRLRREAQHASQLNHPHICTIHEVGAADGQSYIVMEYVDGQRLSDIIPPTGLPVETVLRYGIQIADALAHAHRNGVTHRDLKTANIVITPEGRAKVLDFGLARRDVPQAEKSVTAEGAVAGTLAYMAPELLRGEQADACSDIWALGVVLYEMAAGSRPFAGATGFEQSGAILHEPPAPLPGRIPASLQQIIRRCLAKDPRERYKQANEIRSALETAQVGVAAATRCLLVLFHCGQFRAASWTGRLLQSCRSRRVAWIGGVTLAIIVLLNLPSFGPISTRLHNSRGYALLDAGHPEDAIREFEKNVEAAPREANSYDSLGEAYLVMGAPDTAATYYERALAIDPTYSPSRTGRAWAWGMLGRFDQAITDDPPDPFVKALLLSRVGRYEETKEVLADEGRKASTLLLASMLATERGELCGRAEKRGIGGGGHCRSSRGNPACLSGARRSAGGHRGGPIWRREDCAGASGLAGHTLQGHRSHRKVVAPDAGRRNRPRHRRSSGGARCLCRGEPSRKMWPNLRDTSMVIFANSLSVRDVPARAQAARGDVDGAIQTYRRLLTAGPEQKWAAVYEPRYVLEIARLLNRKGDNAAAKQEYQRFLDFWKNADPGLPEVAEARKVVASM